MPKSEPSGNSSTPRVQVERTRRAKPEQTIESNVAAGKESLSQLPDTLASSDFSQRSFEKHAALLADPRMSRSMYASQRAAIVMQLQRDYGNRYVQRLVQHNSRKQSLAIQAKLTVGPASDKFEQEADQVAKQVMGSLSSPSQESAQVQRQEEGEEMMQMKPLLQRQEEEEETMQMKPLLQRQEEEEEMMQMKPLLQRQEEEEEMMQMKPLLQRQEEEEEMMQMKPFLQRQEEEEEMMQMKPLLQRQIGLEGGDAGPDVELSIQQSQGRGRALPDGLRTSMESAFGADFGGVRVHNDTQANTLDESVGARAFTTGKDIFLGQGEYNPDSSGGQELLAHELTHVVQQGGAGEAANSVQRHAEGAELPKKDDQVAEIATKENLAPAATRRGDKKKAKKAGGEFEETQKLTPGAMSLSAAEKILQGSYGGLKKIVPGTVVVLADQAACSAKYDEVCIADGIARPDGSEWSAGDNAIDDAAAGVTTEGFAWKGVVYVNGKTTIVTATAHEILHNNTEPKFRGKAGETFNEGVTETLARASLKDGGISVPGTTAYPTQVALTKKLIDFVGLDVVKKAYFDDVQKLVDKFLSKGTGTWANLVSAAEALDATKVDAALTKPPKKKKKK